MKYCIVSSQNKKITEKLENYGYKCISVIKSHNVSEPISQHADVLYLKIGEKELLVSECQKSIIERLQNLGYIVNAVKLSQGYKSECRLNIAISDNCVICNENTAVALFGLVSDKEKINVNQGYTKCSLIVLPGDNFITEDEGIYSVLKNKDKNCILIQKGYVKLNGYNYGFIGGASVFLNRENTLLFFGNILHHPDYEKIYDFCKKIGIKIDFFSDMELYDFGGAIIL